MQTKDNMTNTQRLALVYAEKLVAYYEAKNSYWVDADTQTRIAYNEMCDAQNALAAEAEVEGRGWAA